MPQPLTANRLFFIDSIRAFAILMMLQGHFIDTLLMPVYRDECNWAYQIWFYLRGITAPTFFTISGLIFLFLLLKANAKNEAAFRIKKGLYRGLLLLGIGYALRMDLFSWFHGVFNDYFLIVDVLQCIGLSLIMLIGCFVLFKNHVWALAVLLFILGMFCFLTEPFYRNIQLDGIPKVLANYVTTSYGSIFTILPWFGFTAFGGCIATVFLNHAHKKRFRYFTISAFILMGYTLLVHSSRLLMLIYELTDFAVFKAVAYYNYLFMRLGNVLLLLGIFYAAEPILKQRLIGKIGQKTLSIYVIHFIIIFGSFTGVGLKHFYYKSLNPTEAIIGAVFFMVIVCIISLNYVKTNAFIYSWLGKLIKRYRPTAE